jgi:hypothetical protein
MITVGPDQVRRRRRMAFRIAAIMGGPDKTV